MNALSPMTQAVYDRVASLKRPQCAKDVAKYYMTTDSAASKHLRSLYNAGLLEISHKVKSVLYYRKVNLLDPLKHKIEAHRRDGKKGPKGGSAVSTTQIQRAREASAALQNIWGSVVQR